MKLFKKVIFVFVLLLGVFFVACGDEKNPDDKQNQTVEYTVTFVVDGVKTEVKVADGEKASKPADPVKEGYIFVGWFVGTKEYDFGQVKANVEVLAKFEKAVKEYNVKFVVDGAEEVQTVKEGEKAIKPADPVKEGYVFNGWYAGEAEYDFEKAVNADLELVAKFEEAVKEYTVKFVVDGAEETVAVKEGEKVTKPADPVKEGYEFLGWFAGSEVYDFEKAVNADLELVAKFEEIKLGYLTPEELLVAVSKAVNDYSDSLNGSIKIDLVNDEEIKTIVLKYNYADKENVESLEYVVSGTVSTHIYVKNEMVYISSNDVKSQEELTSSSSDLLINKYGVKSLLVPALKFYDEEAFYNALEYVEETENGSKYTLKLANYTGDSINVVGKESVEVFVKAANGEITTLEIVSTSLDKVSKVKVEFNGLGKAEIIYPDGLENYGE